MSTNQGTSFKKKPRRPKQQECADGTASEADDEESPKGQALGARHHPPAHQSGRHLAWKKGDRRGDVRGARIES